MDIRTAVIEAQKSTGLIYRNSENWPNDVYYRPTNEITCTEIYARKKLLGIRWNPNLEDLVADDWEVCDKVPKQKIGLEAKIKKYGRVELKKKDPN